MGFGVVTSSEMLLMNKVDQLVEGMKDEEIPKGYDRDEIETVALDFLGAYLENDQEYIANLKIEHFMLQKLFMGIVAICSSVQTETIEEKAATEKPLPRVPWLRFINKLTEMVFENEKTLSVGSTIGEILKILNAHYGARIDFPMDKWVPDDQRTNYPQLKSIFDQADRIKKEIEQEYS